MSMTLKQEKKMPKFIIKLTEKGRDYFLEWSTVVDAPTTNGMQLDEFKEYYQGRYGTEGMKDLPERLARADITGCSHRDYKSLDEVFSANRAGDNEKHISRKEIIRKYCLEPQQ